MLRWNQWDRPFKLSCSFQSLQHFLPFFYGKLMSIKMTFQFFIVIPERMLPIFRVVIINQIIFLIILFEIQISKWLFHDSGGFVHNPHDSQVSRFPLLSRLSELVKRSVVSGSLQLFVESQFIDEGCSLNSSCLIEFVHGWVHFG